MKRILFICHGNICRSPLAEYVMRDKLEKCGLSDCVTVASAAVSREEIGNPVYPPMKRLMESIGLCCEGHHARQMTLADYKEYDHVIAMDRSNLRLMERICGGDPEKKISLLLSFAHRDDDVADPWYTRDFQATLRDVEEGCSALLSYLRECLSL